VAVAVLLATSCDSTPQPDAHDPPRDERATGGTITFGVLGEPPTLDPYAATATQFTYQLARPVYRSIFRLAPDGTVGSDLVDVDNAGSLRAAEGHAVVTLERARWSNGAPVTATDVVRSVRRARPPSGFAGLRAQALGSRRVRFAGDVAGDWARRLAVGTFVLPRRSALRVASGPFIRTRYVPGLELAFEPNPRWRGDAPLVDRIIVRFVATTQIMLELLEDQRLDAAALPSAINLDERLREAGLRHVERAGRETVGLDFSAATPGDLRRRVIGAVDLKHLEEGVIRDEGSAVSANPVRRGGTDEEVVIQLGTASGDELLQLMQRILQKHLARRGIKAELIQVDPATFYGAWRTEGPLDVALRRTIVPSSDASRFPEDPSWFPMFSVHTFAAYNDGVNGVQPNGTLDGPLWNAQDWWLE